MVTLLTGVMGSGKSVFCVEELTKFKNGTSTYKSHDIILSNIGGFKTDYFNDTPYKYLDLNFSKFYATLKALYQIYLEYEDREDETDQELIKYCKENDFYNCFVIIDEAHHFFDNQDKIKIWYLTYHRHLAHNIFLITQNKMLLHTKYRQLPELYLKALPSTKKVSKDFKYNTYSEFVMKDKIETITIINRPELFEMFTSGNFTKQKSYALKPLLFFAGSLGLVLSLVVFLFYFLSSSSAPTPPPPPVVKPVANVPVKTSTNTVNNGAQAQRVNTIIDSETITIKIFFLNTLGFGINGNYYSIEHFGNFLKATNSVILSQKTLFHNDTRILKEYYIQTKETSLKQFFIYEITPPPPPVETASAKTSFDSPFGSLKLN